MYKRQTVILRPVKGVDRPAIAIQLPTSKGISILLDAGANVDCKTNQLFQFGIMGHVFAEYILEKENPSVGLLSIGEEDGKGNEIVKETFQMLKNSHINFIGNLEGKEVYRGNADVVVCDGFVGNVLLKLVEGIGTELGLQLQAALSDKMPPEDLKKLVQELHSKNNVVDSRGGGPVFGVNGVSIVGHGSASPGSFDRSVSLSLIHI